MTTKDNSGQQISYKTNIGFFTSRNDTYLMSFPKNKPVLPEDVRQFLSEHEHDGVKVTLKITKKCLCEICYPKTLQKEGRDE